MPELTQARRQPLGDIERKRRVQAALKDAGSSQRECCAALALSEATVSRAIAGLQRTPAVEQWICERTGRSHEELFEAQEAAAV